MSQKIETILTLGPKASFSHEATQRIIASDPQYAGTRIEFCSSITDVCQNLADGKAKRAVAPLDNSIDGSVPATLDAFRNHPLRIRGHLRIPVSQSAYYQKGVNPEDIKYLASKDSALGQVRRNAAKVFPNAKERQMNSTVEGVLLAAEDSEVAGIGPRMVGVAYDLTDKLDQIDDFQDDPLNTTDFKILDIQDEEEIPATGNDKTSLIAQISDRSGSLFRTLDIFANQGVNVTKIRYFDRAGSSAGFWIDCNGHQDDRPLSSSFRQLLKQGVGLKLFGSYPIDNYEPPEIPWELDMEYAIERLRREVVNGGKNPDRTTIAFTLKDKVGALRDALQPFHKRGINLSEIDSLPTGKLDEFIFYLAFNNGVNQRTQAIEELTAQCTRIVLL